MYICIMKLTLQIKLVPSNEQYIKLKKVFEVFNDACNVISSIAYERKIFKQFPLHKEVYYPIKEMSGLSSQFVIRAIGRVSDAYKVGVKTQRLFKRGGAVPYDGRMLTYIRDKPICSISLIGKREKIKYVCYRPYLMKYAKGDAKLVSIKGKFYLYQTLEIPDGDKENAEEFIGVDLGVRDLIATSDGDTISSSEVYRVREKYHRIRKSIRSKGIRGCYKLLKRLNGKESRFCAAIDHRISKWLVSKAKDSHRGIAIENLSGIRKKLNPKCRNRGFKMKFNLWSYFRLRKFLEYKSTMDGVQLVTVPPAYTSKTCSNCLCIGYRNKKIFHCKHCGSVLDADINAAKNIATWGYVNTHEKWDLLSCVIRDNKFSFKDC